MKLFGKKSKILAAAIAMMTLSTAAAVTGTVAWFTANNMVTVQGMAVQTKVSSNLLIAEDTLTSVAIKDDSEFTSGPLNQYVRGILEPVSTVDGKNFFYTLDAKADGDAKVDTYVKYGTEAALTGTDATTYADAFSKAYDVKKTDAATIFPIDSPNFPTAEQGAKAYVDYVFQLRAQNSESAAAALKVTSLTLTYNGSGNTEKAFRVALFAEAANASGATVTGGAGTLKSILRHSSSQNFSQLGTGNDENIMAVSLTSSLSAVTYNVAANIDDNIAVNAIKYYKVVARLWIEGEDTTCNNSTFASLNNSWKLAMNIELGGVNSAVTSLATA